MNQSGGLLPLNINTFTGSKWVQTVQNPITGNLDIIHCNDTENMRSSDMRYLTAEIERAGVWYDVDIFTEGRWLTYEILSEQVLSDVLEQRWEDGQQSDGGVVYDLCDSFGLRPRVRELTLPQVLHRLLQIFCCVIKERPQSRFDRVLTGFHHSPGHKIQKF